jgi:3-dehydrosphinganine reductase
MRLTPLSHAAHAGAKKPNDNYPPFSHTAREIFLRPVLPDAEAAVAVLVVIAHINGGLMDFSGKNILISGGSSGIGFALAKRFTTLNANVTILAREKKKLKRALDTMQSLRVSDQQLLNWISADVSHYNWLQNTLDRRLGHIDILINSAGEAYPGKFADLPAEIFKQLIEVNYLGTVYLTKIVTPQMIARKSGHIVIISSMAALIGIYGYTAYASTKYALRGFSKCLRSELKPHKIDVSIVYPPDTDTPQLSFERSIMPEITRRINQGGGVMTAEKVAEVIINGVNKKRFTILPGLESKILHKFAPLFDRFYYHYAKSLAEKELK